MSLTRPYEHIFYIGNGSTRTFSYIFDAINADFVSVSIKHPDGTITDNVNVIVDKDQAQHLIGTITFEPQDTPETDSIIRITRKTPVEQATQYSRSISFNSKNIETSFDLVVAMIQELQDKFKNSSLNQNIFQDEPFSIDFITPEDDGASLVIDYQTKLIKKGLYFKIESGNLHVSSDGISWIMMPKSTEIQEFRQKQLQNPTRWELEYRIGTTWFLAGSSASAIATEALNKANQALETANSANTTATNAYNKAVAIENTIATYGDIVTHDVDEFATAEQGAKADTALQPNDNISELTNDADYQTGTQVNTAISAHDTSTSAHQDIRTELAGKADDSDLQTHINDTDNPHSVTKTQIGLGNVDNTSDLNKPISTATQTALNAKQDTITDLDDIRSGAEAGSTAVQPEDLATVATTGSYNDLTNKPTIPAAQVNSDWNATSGVAEILNKPTIPTKTSDLSNDSGFITSSSVGNGTITITQDGTTKGTFTTNQSGDTTIALDSGGNVDDVQLNGVSVVVDKIANIDLTEYTATEVETLWESIE